MTKTKNKKYPFGKYVSEKTKEKTRMANELAKKEQERIALRAAEDEDEAENLFHIQEMNLENINQKYAANLIVMTIVGLYSITSRDYLTENLKSIIFVLLVQTTNLGCTVYRAHLTETCQFHQCKFLPTIFKVVKAASYWLMLNVIVDYMDNHMPASNYSTFLKFALIISNKGFIAYLAYSILVGEGMIMNQYWAWINPTPSNEEDTTDDDEKTTNNEDSSDNEEEETSDNEDISGNEEDDTSNNEKMLKVD